MRWLDCHIKFLMAEQAGSRDGSNLHHAVAGRFTSLIQSLLENGSKEIVNTSDDQGRTPLHLACSHDKENDVPLFLERNSEVITCRAMIETQQIIELLLRNGANPQALDNNGKSPLHCLVDHWLLKQYPVEPIGKIINQFLQYKGNINVKDSHGRTLLHYVAGFPEIKILIARTRREELRIEHERARMRREELGIVHVQARARQQRVILEPLVGGNRAGDRRIVQRVRFVEIPELRNEPENTAEQGDVIEHITFLDKILQIQNELYWEELFVKLIRFGADMSATDNDGNTPLHFAIATNKFKIVKQLLKGEYNPNIRNIEGQTPLHHAVTDHNKFKNYAILLLRKGALASIDDVRGLTPVDIVKNRKDYPCFIKHLVLLISAKLHPEMKNPTTKSTEDLSTEDLWEKCEQECKTLNDYFQLQDKSQLPILLRYHSFPAYTESEFLQSKINCHNFEEVFPNYSRFLRYKFTQDKIRREVIEKCTEVFSYFGGSPNYTSAGRLVYTRNRHWEGLPLELKLVILSYLSFNELEFLNNHLGR